MASTVGVSSSRTARSSSYYLWSSKLNLTSGVISTDLLRTPSPRGSLVPPVIHQHHLLVLVFFHTFITWNSCFLVLLHIFLMCLSPYGMSSWTSSLLCSGSLPITQNKHSGPSTNTSLSQRPANFIVHIII